MWTLLLINQKQNRAYIPRGHIFWCIRQKKWPEELASSSGQCVIGRAGLGSPALGALILNCLSRDGLRCAATLLQQDRTSSHFPRIGNVELLGSTVNVHPDC